MIVQCDQCSTKFKLDDAKLTETGVKVRCSKCRHIFVVKKEVPQEEPDLDSMLVGLDIPATSAMSSASVAASVEQKPFPSFDATLESSFADEETPGAGPSLTVDENLLKAADEAAEGFGKDSEEFGKEFDFEAEMPSAEAPAEQRGEFDFSAFEMSTSSEASLETATESPQEFDFGEIPTESVAREVEPHGLALEKQIESAEPAGFEGQPGDEFAFEEAAPAQESAHQEAVRGEFDFSFSEPSWEPSEEQAVSESSAGMTSTGGEAEAGERMEFSFAEEIPPAAKLPPQEESFSFEPAPSSEPSGDETAPVTGEKVEFSFESTPLEESRATAEQTAREVPSFASADEPVAVPTVAFEPPADEQLPPLTISSRKKEGGTPLVRTILLGVLLLVAVGAGIFYYLGGKAEKGRPVPGGSSAVKGLPIEIVNVQAGYVMNKEAGELFVVRGEVINRSKEARGSIQVKGAIFSTSGAVLVAQNAYCGNPISNEQLVGMSMAAIEKAMANQFGDSLANMEVKPGKSIPFTIIFANVPADAGDFGVEVAGSTPVKANYSDMSRVLRSVRLVLDLPYDVFQQPASALGKEEFTEKPERSLRLFCVNA